MQQSESHKPYKGEKMFKIYDIHSHILPGVDDGAETMERSMEMLEAALAEGIRGIILTPHYHGGHYEAAAGYVSRIFKSLCEQAKEKYPEIRLYLGNEIYYYPSVPEWLQEGRVHAMSESSYVLLEFAPGVRLREIREAVQHMTGAGYYPILAHAERYQSLVEKAEQAELLIQMGAYIQVNAETINGETGIKSRHFVKKLMKKEQVHFVASDAHSLGRRGPYLRKSAEYLCKHYGEEYTIRLLQENPEKLISNTYIGGE